MAHERVACISRDQAALIFDILLDRQVVMLVVKVRPNAPVLILDVILEAGALEHFFGHLELQCLEDRLILEES